MTHPVYFTSEPSATARGHVGQVVDAETHHVLLRTGLVYTQPYEAEFAAKRLWEGRAATMARAARLTDEVA